jgi:hypothetical protein
MAIDPAQQGFLNHANNTRFNELLDEAKRSGSVQYKNAMKTGKYEGVTPTDPLTGAPLREKWNSMVGTDGNVKSQYQLTDQGNTQALNQFRGEALRAPGSQSQWAGLMNDQIGQKQMSAMDAGNQQIAAGRAGLMSDMAQTGGLGAGARERAFRNSGRDAIMNKQRTLRSMDTDRNNIAVQDETNRQNMLGQTVNMDQSRANYMSDIQKANVSNSMGQVGADRDQKQNMWTKEMENWGAMKQAEAQKGGSCFSGDTLVAMKDGSRKEIQDVQIGDETLLGGIVTQTIKALKDWPGDMYEYMGVLVTGSHAVLENDKFVRVKDSVKAKLSDEDVACVYNLTTRNHIMILGNTVFGDYQETAHDDMIVNLDLSLKRLNEDFRPTLS